MLNACDLFYFQDCDTAAASAGIGSSSPPVKEVMLQHSRLLAHGGGCAQQATPPATSLTQLQHLQTGPFSSSAMTAGGSLVVQPPTNGGVSGRG